MEKSNIGHYIELCLESAEPLQHLFNMTSFVFLVILCLLLCTGLGAKHRFESLRHFIAGRRLDITPKSVLNLPVYKNLQRLREWRRKRWKWRRVDIAGPREINFKRQRKDWDM